MKRSTVLFLAKNRFAFTQASLLSVLRYTNPELTERVVLVDGGSEDGTKEFLRDICTIYDGPHILEFVAGQVGHVCDCFKYVVPSCGTDFLAKIDNDVVVPPYWMDHCVEILDGNPKISFLGTVARDSKPFDASDEAERSTIGVKNIGGVGLFRTKPFKRTMPKGANKYFGFQGFQSQSGGGCAWVHPNMRCFLLDKVPVEPWRGLTKNYISKGYQRSWQPYKKDPDFWSWFLDDNFVDDYISEEAME